MDLAKLQAVVKARQGQIEARKTSGTSLAKIPAGTSRWRILPGWRPESRETYFHDFGQHWIKDAEGKVTAVIVSEADTFGRPDPVADVIWGAYRATKDEGVKKALKELTSRRVVLVNAVQISGANADPTKVVLLGMPGGLANKFHELVMARLGDDINMLDPNVGRDVVITKSGTGLNTEYSLVDAPKDTAIDPKLMDQLVNIDAFIEGERAKGLQKGIAVVNDAVARALTGGAAGGRASLMSVTPPAAAAVAAIAAPPVTAAVAPGAPVASVLTAITPPAMATAAPLPTAAEVSAAIAAAPATPPGTLVAGFDNGAPDDKELNDLLSAIGNG